MIAGRLSAVLWSDPGFARVGVRGAVTYTYAMENHVFSPCGNAGHDRRPWISLVMLTGVILSTGIACRRSAPADAESASIPAKEPVREEPRLQFPEDLNAKDPSVNDFVTHAMLTATGGDYDAFRLLWSAREEPMPREEFLQGWDAVRQVRVRALQQIVIAPDSAPADIPRVDMYAVYVEVSLDPGHRAAKEKPQREAILVIVREQDRWALMRAPKDVRDYMRGKVNKPTEEPDSTTKSAADEASP